MNEKLLCATARIKMELFSGLRIYLVGKSLYSGQTPSCENQSL
uniref:Uncharacterized protein n=1 Tax=Rhizophora mucronata TaxID=61149 RepID=A0A2P2PKT2_RHIMU